VHCNNDPVLVLTYRHASAHCGQASRPAARVRQTAHPPARAPASSTRSAMQARWPGVFRQSVHASASPAARSPAKPRAWTTTPSPASARLEGAETAMMLPHSLSAAQGPRAQLPRRLARRAVADAAVHAPAPGRARPCEPPRTRSGRVNPNRRHSVKLGAAAARPRRQSVRAAAALRARASGPARPARSVVDHVLGRGAELLVPLDHLRGAARRASAATRSRRAQGAAAAAAEARKRQPAMRAGMCAGGQLLSCRRQHAPRGMHQSHRQPAINVAMTALGFCIGPRPC